MRTIPAEEIERCGLSAVDEALKEGPVHVLQDGAPRYVIIDEARYQEMLEDLQEGFPAETQLSLGDLRAGRVRRSTAQEIIDEFGLEP